MSMNNLTVGSGPSPEGLVRTMWGASDQLVNFLLISSLRLQSTCVQSHLGLVMRFEEGLFIGTNKYNGMGGERSINRAIMCKVVISVVL